MSVPFAVRGIDHIVLRARDAPALIRFYANVLGCAVERVSGDLTQLRAGESLIDIVPRNGDGGGDRNMDHLCLTLKPFDVDGVAFWLRDAGVAVGEIATRYGASGYARSIYLTDPEGNGLELREAVR